MNIQKIIKQTIEDIANYYNNECFHKHKIYSQKIDIDTKKIEDLSNESIDSKQLEDCLQEIISKIYELRQLNQQQLTNDGFDVKIFAKNEILLTSASNSFETVSKVLKEIEYLKTPLDLRKPNDINEKFIVRKIHSVALNLLTKYENLPNRLKRSAHLDSIIRSTCKITKTEDLKLIENYSKKILNKHNEILNLDYFVIIDSLCEEYGWIHDVVRLSKLNSYVVGMLVNVDIYSNLLRCSLYTPDKD